MTKQEKIDMINEALSKSSAAQKVQAEAYLNEDGHVRYRKQYKAATGPYFGKATFEEMLSLMWGEDMRRIYKAVYG